MTYKIIRGRGAQTEEEIGYKKQPNWWNFDVYENNSRRIIYSCIVDFAGIPAATVGIITKNEKNYECIGHLSPDDLMGIITMLYEVRATLIEAEAKKEP